MMVNKMNLLKTTKPTKWWALFEVGATGFEPVTLCL